MPYPHGQMAHGGRSTPEVGQGLHGSDTAANPYSFLGRPVNKVMTDHAVASWGQPTPRLLQVLHGGRPASMEKPAVHGHVGDTVDISVGVHVMLESMGDIDYLAFAPHGGGAASKFRWHRI